eukprot:scaffold199086_cov36-Tisochrysis_lutea.AAC.1
MTSVLKRERQVSSVSMRRARGGPAPARDISTSVSPSSPRLRHASARSITTTTTDGLLLLPPRPPLLSLPPPVLSSSALSNLHSGVFLHSLILPLEIFA